MNKEEENYDESYAYVSGYNVFLVILALFFIFGGIFVGQESTVLMVSVWFSGIVLIVIINLLKNILEELRILNDKID